MDADRLKFGVLSTSEVDEVCDLIGCGKSTMVGALTQRTVSTATDNVRTDLSCTDVCIVVTRGPRNLLTRFTSDL